MSGIAEIDVRDTDAVIVNLPAGTALRVHRAGREPVSYTRDDTLPVTAVVWGSVFGGAAICWYGSLQAICNGHHIRDRYIWKQATKVAAETDVIWVEHQQRDWWGRPTWMASRFYLDVDETRTCGACGFPVVTIPENREGPAPHEYIHPECR